MILKGSQRAGASQLAAHLLNDRDNDHVTVLEVRGFMSDDVYEAFAEARAVASVTQCKQFLFSLSLNPPKQAQATEADFVKAAEKAEERLGLIGQPRAIIIHEKEGRRHAHVVWSRIDAEHLKAVNMAFFKQKLTALSKELYLEHGWALPDGLKTNGGKNPLNYTLSEYQQAKRQGLDVREIKDAFREAYRQSDTLKALANALEERGYFLAKGDRRGFVALDVNGEVYSVSRYAGVKSGDMRKQMGDGDDLPSVDAVRDTLETRVSEQLHGFLREHRDKQTTDLRPLRMRNDELRTEHREQRALLKEKQAERWLSETNHRAARLRSGLAGLWDHMSGKAAAIKQQNTLDAYDAARRDQKQRDQLVFDQMRERSALQQRTDTMRLRHIQERKALRQDMAAHLSDLRRPRDAHGREPDPPSIPFAKTKGFTLDR